MENAVRVAMDAAQAGLVEAIRTDIAQAVALAGEVGPSGDA
jgi:hypothetical protein